MTRWQRFRQVVNFVNLSTPLGLLVAVLGRARLTPGPDGLVFAYGYRIPFPVARAFTLGNVVLTKYDADFLGGVLLRHESRHATQYACCLGVLMLPLYVLAVVLSVAICGHHGSWNLFEWLADLDEGGYERRSPWWIKK
ncbi:hypothetical protein [Microtetraspora sp. NBRC 13810]|uniref:hypothetical protein n=1 Tax=Microtetraspora sp. NBRC 13810 TaxID=3030990 RepID=UPI0025529EF7|nr:hypothetical protein [Microtetraspora sp. NBRC 13810]